MKSFKQFSESPPNTADAMKRYKSGKAGFTDIAHLKTRSYQEKKTEVKENQINTNN